MYLQMQVARFGAASIKPKGVYYEWVSGGGSSHRPSPGPRRRRDLDRSEPRVVPAALEVRIPYRALERDAEQIPGPRAREERHRRVTRAARVHHRGEQRPRRPLVHRAEDRVCAQRRIIKASLGTRGWAVAHSSCGFR